MHFSRIIAMGGAFLVLIGCGQLSVYGLPDADTATGNASEVDDASDPNVAPELASFDLSASGGRVEISFRAQDPNDDLEGGRVRVEVNGSPIDFEIPYDLDSWTPNGRGTIALTDVDGAAGCGGDNIDISARIYDDAGNRSAWASESITVPGGAAIPEYGDDEYSAYALGTINSGDVVCGDLYGTGNDPYYGYVADQDWVSISVPQSGYYDLSLTWQQTSADYDFYVLDSYFYDEVGGSYQEGPVQPETASIYLYAYDTYYLVVAGWDGPSGAYQLTIR